MEPGEVAEGLAGCQPLIEAGGGRYVANRAADLVCLIADVPARDGCRAAGGSQDGGQHPEGRGLAGPVRSQEPQRLAGRAGQTDVHRGFDVAAIRICEDLGEADRLDGLGHREALVIERRIRSEAEASRSHPHLVPRQQPSSDPEEAGGQSQRLGDGDGEREAQAPSVDELAHGQGQIQDRYQGGLQRQLHPRERRHERRQDQHHQDGGHVGLTLPKRPGHEGQHHHDGARFAMPSTSAPRSAVTTSENPQLEAEQGRPRVEEGNDLAQGQKHRAQVEGGRQHRHRQHVGVLAEHDGEPPGWKQQGRLEGPALPFADRDVQRGVERPRAEEDDQGSWGRMRDTRNPPISTEEARLTIVVLNFTGLIPIRRRWPRAKSAR